VRTAISIDFDFFVWSGAHARLQGVSPVDGKPIGIDGGIMFDWGHRESGSVQLAAWMWLSRWMGIASWGLNPEQTATLRPDQDCTPIDTFVDELDRRFELNDPTLWIADSHTYGYPTMQNEVADNGWPIEHLISFDQHHDLGYERETVAEQRQRGLVSCESWLYHALRQGYVKRATIVYPDWAGMHEWRGVRSRPWLRSLRGKIAATTWTNWLHETDGQKGDDLRVLFAARSSSWVPPWTDPLFAELVERLATLTGEPLCWDHLTAGTKNKVGAQDACTPRRWDRAEAERALAAWRKQGVAVSGS
jgi:hypothetical protein